MSESLPPGKARWCYAAVHVALAVYLATWLAERGWGPFAFVGLLLPAAATLYARSSGPPLGFMVFAAFLAAGGWLGRGPDRLSPSTLVAIGLVLPVHLASGLRSTAAGRRALQRGELLHLAALPVWLLGLALPAAVLLSRYVPRGGGSALSLLVVDAAPAVAFVWATVLSGFVVAGLASLAAYRRLTPLEAKVHLLGAAREETIREEARIWRRMLSAWKKRAKKKKGGKPR
ncbi:MAG: hypothetical protein HY720_30925 [Planctomycetes bacterium]|nr:hypothetical protein [Planctomycetota bacterium]